MANIDFFAWAVPAFISGSPVDHTWVTTFDNRLHSYPDEHAVATAGEHYWFCWGSYHPHGGTPAIPSGFLGKQKGSLPLAKCLVLENANSSHFAAARGTIFTYGVDGVCHQLANQVLYATKGSGGPMTVRPARGYAASTFLYGTYGLQAAAWASKILSCVGGSHPPSAVTKGAASSMQVADDFEAHAREMLVGEPELLAKLLSLRDDVQRYAAQPMPSFAPPTADTLNARNQHLIDQAAILLGPEKFSAVFGMEPGEKIQLVDPNVTSLSQPPN
jgi:hypothetical protein